RTGGRREDDLGGVRHAGTERRMHEARLYPDLPDERAERVDVVDGKVEKDVVALEDGLGIAADAGEREVDGVAKPAAADHLAELPDDGVEALDVPDRDLHARRPRGRQDLLALREARGD